MMAQVIVTLLTAMVLNLAVLTALKLGLRSGRNGTPDGWADHHPC